MVVRDKNQFIGNLKLDLHEAFDTEEEVFVEIRDCKIEETVGFKVARGDKEQLDYLREVLPKLIVDHSFEHEDGTKLTNGEVTELIFESPWYIANAVYEGIFKWMFRHKV